MSWTSSEAKNTSFDPAPEGSSVADVHPIVGADGSPQDARSASQAAVRLLEMATRDAEALLSDARAEADQLVAAARAEALERRDEADREVARARMDAERQRRDAEQRVAAAEGRVNELVEVERRHRERLVAHFESQLEALAASSEGVAPQV